MRRIAIVLLMVGLLSWACTLLAQRESDRDNKRVSPASLIQLIANGKDFDGQHLRIIGYLDNNGIDRAVGVYLSEVDGRNAVLSNSVDLHLDESVARKLTGKYVIFSGTYHAPPPRSGYNGYIDKILDIKPWNTADVLK